MVADDVMFCCCVKLTDVLPFYCIAFSLGGKHPKMLRQTQHQVRDCATSQIAFISHTDACLRCQTEGKQEECVGQNLSHSWTLLTFPLYILLQLCGGSVITHSTTVACSCGLNRTTVAHCASKNGLCNALVVDSHILYCYTMSFEGPRARVGYPLCM